MIRARKHLPQRLDSRSSRWTENLKPVLCFDLLVQMAARDPLYQVGESVCAYSADRCRGLSLVRRTLVGFLVNLKPLCERLATILGLSAPSWKDSTADDCTEQEVQKLTVPKLVNAHGGSVT